MYKKVLLLEYQQGKLRTAKRCLQLPFYIPRTLFLNAECVVPSMNKNIMILALHITYNNITVPTNIEYNQYIMRLFRYTIQILMFLSSY